jgi:hypothetical protein
VQISSASRRKPEIRADVVIKAEPVVPKVTACEFDAIVEKLKTYK